MSDSNGDTNRIWYVKQTVGGVEELVAVRGVGSFHKTLPHNEFGEVDPAAFAALVSATQGDGREFSQVPVGPARRVDDTKIYPAAPFTNPQAGLATDQMVHPPKSYTMPPAPRVNSNTTAAEMLELYWMAIFRDAEVCEFANSLGIPAGASFTVPSGLGTITLKDAVDEINEWFEKAINSSIVNPNGTIDNSSPPNGDGETDRFILGVDVPGSSVAFKKFTAKSLFQLGFPGDDVGPMISQFFMRPAAYGTQTIDQRQRPYKTYRDYLTEWNDWLAIQNTAKDVNNQSYPQSNEFDGMFFETKERYIATMRDLARFVNKDALHQAYFTATLILLSGGARWTTGNPYHDIRNSIVQGTLPSREAGFGVMGGPHILALVSEVATRALKVVWQQKWQQHLRLRPEAYSGLVHVQNIGVGGTKRAYGLPNWIDNTKAAKIIKNTFNSYLLPMAFTAGSPTHPAYGAGHATVAGACVTVLKAWFLTFTTDADGKDRPVDFGTLTERAAPFGGGDPIKPYCARRDLMPAPDDTWYDVGGNPHYRVHNREEYKGSDKNKLTIEGELNKLAQNVAMGRTMGGVHWRTDNARSLMLGEALAAEMLADITTDANEKPSFTFRTFSRRSDGEPKKVLIKEGRIFVDGVERTIPWSML
jgi:hypothetical protein